MKTIKGIGIFGLLFLLYAVALKITTVVLAAIPDGALEFCYESIVSGSGKPFYIAVLIIQVGIIIAIFGRLMRKQYKLRDTTHPQHAESENDRTPILSTSR